MHMSNARQLPGGHHAGNGSAGTNACHSSRIHPRHLSPRSLGIRVTERSQTSTSGRRQGPLPTSSWSEFSRSWGPRASHPTSPSDMASRLPQGRAAIFFPCGAFGVRETSWWGPLSLPGAVPRGVARAVGPRCRDAASTTHNFVSYRGRTRRICTCEGGRQRQARRPSSSSSCPWRRGRCTRRCRAGRRGK